MPIVYTNKSSLSYRYKSFGLCYPFRGVHGRHNLKTQSHMSDLWKLTSVVPVNNHGGDFRHFQAFLRVSTTPEVQSTPSLPRTRRSWLVASLTFSLVNLLDLRIPSEWESDSPDFRLTIHPLNIAPACVFGLRALSSIGAW